MSAQLHHFDRSKPFYPIVTNYLSQLIGFTELAVRGLAGARSLEDLVRGFRSKSKEEPAEEFIRKLSKLSATLELRSEAINDHIEVPLDALAREVVDNHVFLLAHFLSAAGFVFVAAHEVSLNKPWHNQDPMWEFLRHCRHAVAHGGRFHFVRDEPRRAAHWRTFVLDRSLQGTPLFKGDREDGMLSPGDPIRLLWDIEQAYPSMSLSA